MENDYLMLKYELFCRLLLEEKMFQNSSVSYSSLCSLIHVDEHLLEDYIFEELGTGGQELIESLRINFLAYLYHKYGEEAFR